MNIWGVAAITWVFFTALYLLALAIKNSSIVDIAWGVSFNIAAIAYQLMDGQPHGWVFVGLVLFWGLRLSWHIGKRNLGRPEDFRYAAWRRDWGSTYLLRSYLQIFMLQGALMLVISLAHLSAMGAAERDFSPLSLLGVVVYVAGLTTEAIADAQLKAHTRNPNNKGKLIRTGLWQYSRHPNYFGEAVVWWGVFIVAFSYGAPWWTIVSPLTITYLLRFVSGVPILERSMSKYPGFADYCASTSIFVPWFPKRSV